MADGERGTPGERVQIPAVVHAGLSSAVIVKQEEEAMSGSSAMETEGAREAETLGTESLPQTYSASPRLLPVAMRQGGEIQSDTGIETLPQTGLTAVYATTDQAAYTETGTPRTYILESQQAYVATDTAAIARESEQLAHVSSSLPSAVMTQAGYVIISNPDDVDKIHVSLAGDVGRSGPGVSQDDDGMSMRHVDDRHTGSVEVGDSQVIMAHGSDTSTISMPYTGDINRVSVTAAGPDCRILPTGTAVDANTNNEDSKLNLSQAEGAVRVQVPGGYTGLAAYAEADLMTGNIAEMQDMRKIAILTTSDVSRIATFPGEMGCINSAPASLTTSDGSRISLIDGNRISSLTTSDGSRISLIDGNRISSLTTSDGSRISLTAADGSRINSVTDSDGNIISPLTAAETGIIGSLTASEASRLSFLPAGYASRLNEVYLQSAGGLEEQEMVDSKPIILPQTGNVSLPALRSTTTDVSRSALNEMAVTTLPQTGDFSRLAVPHTVNIRADGLQSTDLSGMSIYQSGPVVHINLPATGAIGQVNLSQDGDDNVYEIQQKPDISKLNIHEAGSASVMQKTTGIHLSSTPDMETLHKPDIGKLADVSGLGAYELQQSPSARIANQDFADNRTPVGELRAVDAYQAQDMSRRSTQSVQDMSLTSTQSVHGSFRVSMQSDNAMRVHDSAAVSHGALYLYPDMTTLPQTSDIKADDDLTAHMSKQLAVTEVEKSEVLEQPDTKFIKMKMVAEAAELVRNSLQADDSNMRLMAETADYVSRNVPQPAAIAASGMAAPQGKVSGNTPTAQNYNFTSGTGEKTTGNGEGVPMQNFIRSSLHIKETQPASQTERWSHDVPKDNSLTHSDRAAGHTDKELLQSMNRTSMAPESSTSAVPSDAWQNRSYHQWKEIGKTHNLFRDEDIACFLMRYYENASQILPFSGSTACTTCHRPLAILCLNCQHHGNKDSDRSVEMRSERSKEEGKREDASRTRLWKLIQEAGSKDAKEGKVKKKVEKQTSRRKPTTTHRVLRRREKEPPPASSYDSQDEISPPVTSSKVTSSVKQQKEKKPAPTMVTRKRGRPSRESYLQATTLDCPKCQKQFHTALGLDQHVKLHRCKVSKVPEMKTNTNFSLGLSSWKCSDCGKQYCSKQGLTLHRSAQHTPTKDKLYSAVSNGEEDTDEYTPPKKPSPTSGLECPNCHKKFRSRQRLIQHRAAKHSEPDIKKLKMVEEKATVGTSDMGRESLGKDLSQKEEGLSEKKKEPVQNTMGSGDGERSQKPAEKSSEEGNEISSQEKEDDMVKEEEERGVQTLECKECHKKYHSRPGYLVHMRTKHWPHSLLSCHHCPGRFKTKVELRIHIRRDHSQGQLMLFCPYCPQTFHDRTELRSHMEDSHKTCRRILYDCFACELQFSSRIERKRHIQSEHKGRDTSLTCHFCGGWFATRHEFDQHEREGHPEQIKSWLCATCGDAFQTRYLLQRHTLIHKDKVMCKLCNKSITEPCYEDHMKRHYGKKIWSCEVCPKSFIRKAELQQHMLVHRDERPFCCELCGMRYREKSRLNSHMRTHSGIKPYKCQQCEKNFTRSRELKNHMRVHTGEKPFSCSVCERRFASSGNLSAHRRKVHKLDPIPHGQQSRRHTLEERVKAESSGETAKVSPAPSPATSDASLNPTSTTVEVAQSVPSAHQPVLPAPEAHQVPVTVHQVAVVAQQDASVVYPQHLESKFEAQSTPEQLGSEQYVTSQAGLQNSQGALQMYWPSTSYSEES